MAEMVAVVHTRKRCPEDRKAIRITLGDVLKGRNWAPSGLNTKAK
jgi:hypothetical protein